MGACLQAIRPALLEKVQLQFELADLLVQLVLRSVGLLANLLAAVAEDVRQVSQVCFFQPGSGSVSEQATIQTR